MEADNQDKWLLVVTKEVHEMIHSLEIFRCIDPKRNKTPINRLQFLKELNKLKKYV